MRKEKTADKEYQREYYARVTKQKRRRRAAEKQNDILKQQHIEAVKILSAERYF